MTGITLLYHPRDGNQEIEKIRHLLAQHFNAQDIIEVPAGSQAADNPALCLQGCQVLLVVFGRSWALAENSHQQKYLLDPGDPMRLLLEKAIQDLLPVIPILIEPGDLPLPENLPATLNGLYDYQEIKLRSEPYFKLDFKRLVQKIETILVTSAEYGELAQSEELPGEAHTREKTFTQRGKRGQPEDVDFLMENLALLEDFAATRLVDYALSLVRTRAGVERIHHYLFHGELIQRNYAALFFKRKSMVHILEKAVAAGAVDREQAFSR